jgi:hypothetical protein
MKIKDFTIAVLVLVIILLNICTPKCPEISEPITIIDTVYFSIDKPYEVIVKVPVPTKVPYPVPYSVHDTIRDTILLVNRYHQAYEDSLLSGDLFATINGELLDWGFTYTPKFPKYINTTTTNTIDLTPKHSILIGASIHNLNNQNIYTNFALSYYNNGNLIQGFYDPFNKYYGVGLNKQIWKK